jgi:uncharacterized protein (TIGR02270 family)
MGDVEAARRSEPLWDLVEESLEEAQFLWRRFEATLATHARDLAGLSFWVEERLLGTIDGLRAGGSAAIEPLLVPALDAEDPFRAIAAAHTLAVDGNDGGIEALFTAVRAAEGPKLSVFTRAIALSRSEVLLGRIERAIPETGPELAAVLWRIRGFRQRDPGPDIAYAILSAHPGLRAAALIALRHIPDSRALGQIQRDVEQDLGASDRAVRDAAINTGLILGISAAWNRCLELAAKPAPGVAGAMLLVAMLGNERDQDRVLAAVGNEAMRADALFAAGFAGTRAAIEVCLQAMTEESVAKLAAEAFCAITGLDLERERLVAAPPDEPAEPIPLEEEDLDADLVPKAEDLLPSPDVPGVVRWWSRQAGRFAAGKRYLGGRLVDLVVLQDALLRGPMRRRYATALELAVRTAGRYQVETHAFSAEQRRQMSSFDRLGGGAIRRSPLSRFFSYA